MKSTKTILVLTAFIAASFASAGSIEVVHDPETDFFTYKTYHWGESELARVPELREYLVRHVDQRLKAAGLERVESGGDLAISIWVSGQTTAANVGGYYNHVTFDIAIITSQINVTGEGTLFIDMVDSFRNRVVWHGQMKDRVNYPDVRKMRKKIDKVVKKMFRDYPPITGL
jgi:hypothetical protein